MIFSMTSALERLSLEQQDATSLSLHVDLYARVRHASLLHDHRIVPYADVTVEAYYLITITTES